MFAMQHICSCFWLEWVATCVNCVNRLRLKLFWNKGISEPLKDLHRHFIDDIQSESKREGDVIECGSCWLLF